MVDLMLICKILADVFLPIGSVQRRCVARDVLLLEILTTQPLMGSNMTSWVSAPTPWCSTWTLK